ncbi:unnamed protein product [Polarella glacialis]|uniref:Uncharacterized protein n=1 Tax=Polarella glacialis TaxID=89957 RepID=A0A813KUD2_POLGL|nr:unnamed protein product [Polarella glacialis]
MTVRCLRPEWLRFALVVALQLVLCQQGTDGKIMADGMSADSCPGLEACLHLECIYRTCLLVSFMDSCSFSSALQLDGGIGPKSPRLEKTERKKDSSCWNEAPKIKLLFLLLACTPGTENGHLLSPVLESELLPPLGGSAWLGFLSGCLFGRPAPP